MNGEFYNNEQLSLDIEQYCRENNINEEDFADAVGIHPTSLSRIKAGKHCSTGHFCIITALLGKQPKDYVRQLPTHFTSKVLLALNLKQPIKSMISV